MRFEAGTLKHGWRRATLVSACVAVVGGCASAAPGTGSSTPLEASAPSEGSLEVLTGDEIRATGAGNVWEAVRRLRPLWLSAQPRAASLVSPRPAGPVLYVAGVPQGSLQALQSMSVDQVRRVEFINARDATTRYGTGHTGGVIMVDLDR